MVHFKFISIYFADITSDKNHMVRWMDKQRQQYALLTNGNMPVQPRF